MEILQNISLKDYNTFGIDVKASHFISITSVQELQAVLKLGHYPIKFILGGGSNMLLTKNVDALVIHVNIKGIEIVKEDKYHVLLKANAGENWHHFVEYAIEHNYGGLENLSLIPGNVGTAPIQNIGAYGVELKDTFYSCTAVNIKTGATKTFNRDECLFNYRESVFKSKLKGEYIITSVIFKLTKTKHQLKTGYGAIATELENKKIESPTIKDISDAVIHIRQSKLPDPKKIGNSGSFFKNPIISKKQFEELKLSFGDVPSYTISQSKVKVPAGWLIEKAGFKGKTYGNYGVHKNQALVLVNYGGATGKQLLELANLIKHTISILFDIEIETEVNII